MALYLLLGTVSAARGGQDSIAAIRASFAEAGRLAIEETRVGSADGKAFDNLTRQIKRQPQALLLKAVDESIRTGSIEERTFALELYTELVYLKKAQPTPAHKDVLLDLLAHDDFSVGRYDAALFNALRVLFPSRETVLAFMDSAHRSPDQNTRKALLGITSDLVNIWSPELQQGDEKAIAEFEEWFKKNRDRIQFTKDGEFRLAGHAAVSKPLALSTDDRDRIRRDPVCVLRLSNLVFSDEDTDKTEAKGLASKCGAALFGAEGSGAVARTLEEGEEGASLEDHAALTSLAGPYPTEDAVVLAAIYVTAYVRDLNARHLALETLVRTTPDQVRRVGKGEPRSMVKKAEALTKSPRSDESK